MSDDPLTADNTFAELMRKISREKRMGDIEQKVIGGSPTARRLGELTPDANTGGAGMELATQAATGGTAPGIGLLVNKLANVLGGAFRGAVRYRGRAYAYCDDTGSKASRSKKA